MDQGNLDVIKSIIYLVIILFLLVAVILGGRSLTTTRKTPRPGGRPAAGRPKPKSGGTKRR